MQNYMNCTQMMFGKRVRYCVAFKTNQRSFEIYRPKCRHEFKVPVHSGDFEDAIGLEIVTLGAFFVTQQDRILIFESEGFKQIDEIKIQLQPSNSREANEIIAIRTCQNEEYLAVICGKRLIRRAFAIDELFIYKRRRDAAQNLVTEEGLGPFELAHHLILKDQKIFEQVCMIFHFQKSEGRDKHSILFAKIDQVFSLNFVTEEIQTIYKFEESLLLAPSFFQLNDNQSVFVVAS